MTSWRPCWLGGAKEYYISGCHVFVLFETQQYGDSYVKAGFPLGIISGNGQESFLCLASSRSFGPNGSNTKETFLSVPVLSVFLSGNTRKRFPAFLYWLLFSRESRTTSSLLETKQKGAGKRFRVYGVLNMHTKKERRDEKN